MEKLLESLGIWRAKNSTNPISVKQAVQRQVYIRHHHVILWGRSVYFFIVGSSFSLYTSCHLGHGPFRVIVPLSNFRFCCQNVRVSTTTCTFIIWLNPWAAKIRLSSSLGIFRVGPAWKHSLFSHIINPLLAKFVRSMWLYIGQVFFGVVSRIRSSRSFRSVNLFSQIRNGIQA